MEVARPVALGSRSVILRRTSRHCEVSDTGPPLVA
jgi:hypothetical protein